MNNRKWPRTLNEAFPGSFEYSCAIERPRPRGWFSVNRLIGLFVAAALITLLIRNAIIVLA